MGDRVIEWSAESGEWSAEFLSSSSIGYRVSRIYPKYLATSGIRLPLPKDFDVMRKMGAN